MEKSKLTGLIAAPYTGFDANGDVNLEIIEAYANHLKSSGVSGVFVNGTTGEGVSLTIEERKATIEQWVKHKTVDFKVLAHIGHDSLKSIHDLAKHSVTHGVDAVGLMASPFFKSSTVDALVDYVAHAASAVSETPVYYYHIPSMTGAHFQMIEFLEKARTAIPNLAGIKFTHEDLMDMKLCMDFENGAYNILHGRDEILLCGLSLGVGGAIGSTYNYLAPLFIKLIAAYRAGHLQKANELQLTAIHIIRELIRYGGGVRAGKSIMKMVGLDFGGNRLPLQSLDPQTEASFFKALDAHDIRKHMTY